MTKNNDGGPAFPQPNHIVETDSHGRQEARNWMQDSGMSLRDWFAGMALQGLISHYGQQGSKDAAINAFELADALLAERAKGEK